MKTALDVKQDENFVVAFTTSSNVYSADKTFAATYAAYNAGKNVICTAPTEFGTSVGSVSLIAADIVVFTIPWDDGTDAYIDVYYLYKGNSVDFVSKRVQKKLTFDQTPKAGSSNPVASKGIKTALDGKQDTLVSGTNIKTVNGNTLLGSGNVSLKANNILMSDDDPNGDWVGGDTVEEALVSKSNAIEALQPNEIASITTTESSVSGGNNSVTITETNGTSHTFNVKNGKDGADGVSLGEIALVQTTGDSEESVMSQKAVTEYARKVTDEDLNGTSTWIRSKLEESGWEFGVQLGSDGRTYAYSQQNAGVTCIIPVNENIQGHEIIFTYKLNKITSAYINGYNESGRMGYINGQNDDNVQSTTLTNSVYANLKGLRFTVDFNNIPACSIYDNTAKKYIWRGDEYLYDFIKDFDVNLSYEVLLNSIITQEFGTFSQKTISQKVISEQFDAHDYIDKRYTYINGALCSFAFSDYPEIDIREAEGISLVMDGENVAVSYNAPLLVISNTRSISSTNPMFMIHSYWSSPYVGIMNGWTSPVSGQGTSFPTNKTYNKWAHQVITFDFNTGEANIYVNGELWTTATVANFDKNAFRTALRAQTHMYLNAPTSTTQPTKITGLAVFPRAITASEVATLFGAGGDETRGSLIPNLYNAYDMLAHTFTTWNVNWHTQTADVTTNEDGGKNLTLRSGQTGMQFGFTGLSSKTSFYHSIDFDFTVVSGSCKFNCVQYNNNIFKSPCTITDSSGNVVDFANTILTSGNTYHMRCVPTLPYNPSSYGALIVGFRFENMETGSVLWIHENIVLRERGTALKLLRENFRGTYWELYNGVQIPIMNTASYNSNTAFTAYNEPFKQNTVKYNSSNPPQFNGQMAIDSANSRVYTGILTVNGGTWKQINNS